MKVLFLHPNTPDYLSSGLFHGLRTILGKDCVDLPRFDAMYKPLTAGMRNKIRGRGFTLYGLLDDIPELAEERFFIWHKNIKDFDLYIISDIWLHLSVYQQLKQIVPPGKIMVIDPADTQRIFPFNNLSTLFTTDIKKLGVRFHRETKYYKREIGNDTRDCTGLPAAASRLMKSFLPADIRPIHFSIPEEKITRVSSSFKTKLFTNNIVDEAVSRQVNESHFIPLGVQQYSFENEAEYYQDIQHSRYGITVKRSGWDCLRHYEYAANGAVLCFKDLNNKPARSAPHGLNEQNSISYSSYLDLKQKIESIDEIAYEQLQANSYKWIYNNTTKMVAQRLLNDNK